MAEMNSDGDHVGRGKPPTGSRFRKGQSGNPRGRPRGSKRQAPYETVLGQVVTVREDGKTRRMTAAEAFLLHITRRGLEGDGAAARAAMAAIEEARARRIPDEDQRPKVIIVRGIAPGAVNTAMLPLRMAVTLDPCRDTARTVIEPWLVEAALARLGERRLTLGEQAVVWKAARTPWKVKWPAWWEYQG